jgi:hypothetical protein
MSPRVPLHKPGRAGGLAIALVGGAGIVAALVVAQPGSTSVPPSALFTSAGTRIASGARLTNAGLLPISVHAPSRSVVAVKFTADGRYLGTVAAPFKVPLTALSAGEHKIRYTAKAGRTVVDEQTIRFTVVGTAVTGGKTTTPPAAGHPTAPAPSTSAPNTSTPNTSTPPVSPVPPVTSSSGATTVHDAVQLQQALAAARPGEVITLADGSYSGKSVKDPSGKEPGRFVIRQAGTAAAPITLRGSRNAVLDGGGTGGGYAIHLVGAQFWHLEGFTVRDASKGIVLDGASHNVIDGVHVTAIGQEGVHFRSFSTDNVIRASTVDNTGLGSPNYGEGVYIGSAQSNWGTYTNGQPDRSDRNQVIDNRIVDTAAENVDIKEGSTGGVITGNVLGGNRIADKNSADSWIDVKGNGYLVSANSGATIARPRATECGDPKGDATSPKNPFCDGIQVHVILPGWGQHNTFTKNVLAVNAPGVGIWLQNTALDVGNVIKCDNVVTGARSGAYAYNHYTALKCTS